MQHQPGRLLAGGGVHDPGHDDPDAQHERQQVPSASRADKGDHTEDQRKGFVETHEHQVVEPRLIDSFGFMDTRPVLNGTGKSSAKAREVGEERGVKHEDDEDERQRAVDQVLEVVSQSAIRRECLGPQG